VRNKREAEVTSSACSETMCCDDHSTGRPAACKNFATCKGVVNAQERDICVGRKLIPPKNKFWLWSQWERDWIFAAQRTSRYNEMVCFVERWRRTTSGCARSNQGTDAWF